AALRRKDGALRQTLLTASVIELDGVPCVLNVTRDITEQRMAEDQQRRLAAILEATPDLVGMAEIDGTVNYVNHAGRRMLGWGQHEDLRHVHITEFHPQWAAWLVEKEGIPTAARDGVWQGETVLLTRKGTEIPVSQVIVAHHDPDGALVGFSTVARDISERKLAEAALRNSEERFSRAFQSSPDSISITTLRDGRYLEINDRFVETSGYSRKEAIGKTAMELGLWVDTGERAELLKCLQHDGVIRDHELRLRMRSGEIRTGVLSAERITLSGVECMLSVVRDTTERRRLEEQLHQAQKMEAIGRLAGGVAHDFNNLLMVIKGYTELLADGLTDADPRHANVGQVLRAADRAASLTRQLLAFSRKQVIQPQVLNLNRVLVETEKMLRRLIGEDIDLEVRPAQDLGEVKADPGQMEQVLLNLAVNARDAMPSGGRLLIETSNVTVDGTLIPSEVEVRPGPYVLLTVTDTGCGMDKETLAHLFEPFFTTKELGKGTGLGLATVYGVVRQSGGWIRVYSEVGHGSTFRIYLPLVNAPAAPVAAAPPSIENLCGSETILLVEDDQSVRQLTHEFLTRAGYNVMEAPNGEEGMRLAGQCQQPIHLLISDVVMPKVSGRELAGRLVEQRPAVKVLFVSGYTDNIILPDDLRTAGFEFLPKPFRRDALLRKVRDLLDRAEG
ncbi:MAG TPA: PAS domain S-box protein, partial [Candidatus Acidoferrales bacterium]